MKTTIRPDHNATASEGTLTLHVGRKDPLILYAPSNGDIDQTKCA